MIKFGTSGWRAVIGEEFTFDNTRLVVQAIANVMQAGPKKDGKQLLIIGYDTRFLSEKFALAAARLAAANGLAVQLASRDTPTPVLSFEIIRRKAAGGLNFTASHNPPEYNGIKFSTSNGAPALPEITQAIEAEIGRLTQSNYRAPALADDPPIEEIDTKPSYLEDLAKKVDVAAIKKSGLRIAVDSLYGTAREYLDHFLFEAGVPVKVIHNFRDPYFGGYSPECSKKNLAELKTVMLAEGYDLGLGTDGDADRFGVLDKDGTYITPNLILGLLLNHLVVHKGWRGGAARSVATTHLLDAIAAKHGLPLYETPVGFKYIGELLLQGKIILGGEESAGLTVQGHLPEKDGILACLLVAEMVAVTGKTIAELSREIFADVGCFFNKRVDLKLTPRLKESLAQKMAAPPDTFAGKKVEKVVGIDGLKLYLGERDWILLRLSGTEPLVRIYAESGSREELAELMKAGKAFANA